MKFTKTCLSALVLAAAAFCSSAWADLNIKYFETVKEGDSTKVYVFVGGASGSFHTWDAHIASIKDEHATIVGYEGPNGKGSHPHNEEYMDVNAQHIADGIHTLKEKGFKEIHILAVSMGGLVSRKAIMESQDVLSSFDTVSFTTVSSPFGGYTQANSAKYMPGIKFLSKLFDGAMTLDIAAESEFIHSLTAPLPDYVATVMIDSLDDPVAQPTAASTKETYAKISSTVKVKLTLEGGGDHMFGLIPSNLQKQGIDLIPMIEKISKTEL